MKTPLLRISEEQLLHRSRHADIAQPSFFLEPVEIIERTLVRKQAILHAAQEDHGKFQTLGRMEGHHLNAVFPLLSLALT